MNKEMLHITSIKEYYRLLGIGGLKNPLISVLDYTNIPKFRVENVLRFSFNFYTISLKKNYACKAVYGQTKYDFDEGLMGFTAPHQVHSIDEDFVSSDEGWLLLIHPDFLHGFQLAKKIKTYHYFHYAVNEALILSEDEEKAIEAIFKNIASECARPIDHFSQEVLISHIELLLTLCNRYYHRQFITRKIPNNDLLSRFETLLDDYFQSEKPLTEGFPTVTYFAEKLNLSSKYLSELLKSITGQTTQTHIHEKLIEKAKEKLSATPLTINEIAYELGFEHSQSFSKLFKAKTKVSPLEFRASFN